MLLPALGIEGSGILGVDVPRSDLRPLHRVNILWEQLACAEGWERGSMPLAGLVCKGPCYLTLNWFSDPWRASPRLGVGMGVSGLFFSTHTLSFPSQSLCNYLGG